MRISDWSSDVCSSDLHSDIHASIRAVNGPVDDSIRSDKLFDYRLIAVGAPSVASGVWPLRTPADLKNATLLHSLARPEDWGVWLRAVGAGDIPPEGGMKFESSAMEYRAYEQGMGVALTQSFQADIEQIGTDWCRERMSQNEQISGVGHSKK